MAAATVATQALGLVLGDRRVSVAKLSNVIDTNTWDTGLSLVEAAFTQINEATAAAADAVGITISGGTITFDVDGTISSLFVQAIGV
jgi:hypothetical protein